MLLLKPGPSTLTAASRAHCQLPMPAPQQAPEPERSALALLALKVPADQQAAAAVRYSMPCVCFDVGPLPRYSKQCLDIVSNGVGHRLVSILLCLSTATCDFNEESVYVSSSPTAHAAVMLADGGASVFFTGAFVAMPMAHLRFWPDLRRLFPLAAF